MTIDKDFVGPKRPHGRPKKPVDPNAPKKIKHGKSGRPFGSKDSVNRKPRWDTFVSVFDEITKEPERIYKPAPKYEVEEYIDDDINYIDQKIANYRDNPNLKKSGVELGFTQEQFNEYAKCSVDPVYFIKKYVKIINLDHGLMPFNMYDFQENLVNQVHTNRFNIIKIPRQSGKCLQSNVNIKIRNKTTGEIKEMSVEEFYESKKCGDM